MKPNNGVAAGFLAVLTVVGVSNLPMRSPEKGAPGENKKTVVDSTRKTLAAGNQGLSSPCADIAKRLRRILGDTNRPVDGWQFPASCYPSGPPTGQKDVRALPEIHFAVATIPNPVSTHLPLMFDRLVDSIQQAAQDEGYSYDASWFPWDGAPKTYDLLQDQLAAQDLQDMEQAQPGVIVFRRAIGGGDRPEAVKPYGGGLVVFLVGEQPTGGISDDQFENALAWIAQLDSHRDATLRVLGPTFSGTLPSLIRALQAKPHGFSKFVVSSGTVSSARGSQQFGEWINGLRNGSIFHSAMESDKVMVERFCEYLGKQGYNVRDVAFLSEDETAFGQSGKPDKTSACSQAISFYYPRDIATLRSAYEQQSILNPAKTALNPNSPSTALRGDLSEPSSNDHDTVRSYGGQLTPLAQESILLNIAHELSNKRIQFIVLRSTNSLDQIFLSQFLRRSYPEGRVVIDGADLLFNRGAEGKSLRGVMLLSTYPLLTSGHDWTPLMGPRTHRYRTFGGDTSEGVYKASLALFRGMRADNPIMADCAGPATGIYEDRIDGPHSATWLTVIGRRQFWPLAELTSNTVDNGGSDSLRLSCGRDDASPNENRNPSALRLPTATWMFLLVCLLGGAIHYYFCSDSSIIGWPRARAYFAPIARPAHPALIAAGSLTLSMLAVSVAAGSGLFSWMAGAHPFHETSTGLLLLSFLLVSLALAAGACWKNYSLAAVCASDSCSSQTGKWRRVAIGAAVACLGAFTAIQVVLIRNLTPENLIPAYWRSVNLTSGVSGMLPEILLLGGIYLWFWFNLRGLAHFGDDRPSLPKLADLPQYDDGKPMMPMFSEEVAGKPLEDAAMPLGHFKQFLGILAITLIVCRLALGGNSVRTLGELMFGTVAFGWVCLCASVILTDTVRTWQAWNELRRLLVYLDRLPLRRTLRALRGLAWGSIWKMSGNVLEERYRVISLQIESFRHLTNTMATWAPDSGEVCEEKNALTQEMNDFQDATRDFAKWFVTLKKGERVEDINALHNFQKQVASVAGMVLKNILVRAWRSETESLIFGRSNAGGSGEMNELDMSTEKLEPHVRAAEEFFVLPYLAFIQNILGRMRTIALGTLWLFVGATLAVSSYPFEPLSVLGGIFLAVFVIAGGVTVLVYSQMSRDATLSHITNTQPGHLGWDFWLRMVGFGVGPLLGLLTTLFPSITDFALSWLQPSVEALK